MASITDKEFKLATMIRFQHIPDIEKRIHQAMKGPTYPSYQGSNGNAKTRLRGCLWCNKLFGGGLYGSRYGTYHQGDSFLDLEQHFMETHTNQEVSS